MQTVLVTGMERGIGRALAEKFLKEGYDVIGTYFSTVPDLTHDNLSVYGLDLSLSDSILDCSNQIIESGKKIDIFINNAGVMEDKDEVVVIIEKLRKTLEVNLIGTIDFTERLLGLVNNGGHIINITSTAGSFVETEKLKSHSPGHYPAYKISKTALNMYTLTLSQRLKEEGVVVSAFHPGWVRTEMGGPDAGLSPEEAAEGIYGMAISHPETGGFWFQDRRLSW